jgi:type IV secretory pathway VirB3-like protein
MTQSFAEQLAEQRWDDHRYYHQSRINQSLHFVSAVFFLISYVTLFFDPALAALLAWGVSMTTRQAGHFFFEPKGYDHLNQASHEHKEAIKVGYNLQRKVVLMGLWLAGPMLLALSPSLFGFIAPAVGFAAYLHDVGMFWLALGVTGVFFRVLQLWLTQDLRTGLVWATKIVTDPFHDIKLYWKAPYYLMKGQWLVQAEDLAHRH